MTYLYDQSMLQKDLHEAQWVIVGTVTELLAEYKPEGGNTGETYFVPTVVNVDRVFSERGGEPGANITVRQTCHTHYVSPEPLPHLEVGKQYFFCLHLAPDGETVLIGGSAAEITAEDVPVGLLERYRDCFMLYETEDAFYEAVEAFLALPRISEPAWDPADADTPWEPGKTDLYDYPVMTTWEAVKKLALVDGCRSVTGEELPADLQTGAYTEAEIVCRSGFPYYRFTYPEGKVFYTPAIYPEYIA
ncbi:MAG: hypothetical protein IJ480_09810 [Clostridia bacterium]|nr:hypothetical protein [Clostridia bacterium]